MEQRIIEEIKKIVIDCGKLILNANHDKLNLENKEGNNNIVTKYDILVQQKLKKELLNIIPNADFIGEENNCTNFGNNEYKFVVDPIDGTTNFSRDIKICAISVGLLQKGEPIIGVCYNPFTDELYEAQKGQGAYLNGKEIHVSKKQLKEGIVLCGSASYYDELRKETVKIQQNLSLIASDFRRFGSSVLEICNIASGKAEVYFELKLMPWDYTAASLILKEAGGKITTITGDKIQYQKPTSILASNEVEDYLKYIN